MSTSHFSERGYEAVIGLEIHAQLNTHSKMFSSDSTKFDALDNENISPVTLGMPGTLPVMNYAAIECAIKAGLALQCQIKERSVFSRKNYFYPDLPKGYQISQYDLPVCEKGEVEFVVDGKFKKIHIERAHLEEDAGKSIHLGDHSLINYNRAGIALLEIVSGPDMRSAAEAAEYARTVRSILRYLNVCDGNLEEGSLRCDCNVSVRKIGAPKFGTKVEIKNVNSFRFVEKAIDFEIDRQIEVLEGGGVIPQETRLWDPDKNRTFSMRTKENANDYRYFPDPDLLPLIISKEWIETIRNSLPELPKKRLERFQTEYGLPLYDAAILTAEKSLADYFERAVKTPAPAKSVSNWIMTELLRELNNAEKSIEDSPIKSDALAELVNLIENGTISGKIGKSVFTDMWKTGESAKSIVSQKGLTQISDLSSLEKLVDEMMAANPGQVAEYRSGKTKLFGFFVGATMKLSKGQANPDMVNDVLKRKLDQK